MSSWLFPSVAVVVMTIVLHLVLPAASKWRS